MGLWPMVVTGETPVPQACQKRNMLVQKSTRKMGKNLFLTLT